MQLQFVKSALTVNPCMVSKPVMRRCGGCLQATHLLKNRGLPACKFAARFARPSKWTACLRQVFRLGNLLRILFRLCPPMPFRLFNTLFVRLLKSGMSKNVFPPYCLGFSSSVPWPMAPYFCP